MGLLDQRVQIRAVAAGVAVDWLGTSIFVALVWIVLGFSGVVEESDVQGLVDSTGFLLFGTIVGVFFTTAGGGVAGFMAAGEEVKHAAVTGTISLVLGVLMMVTSTGEAHPGTPQWYQVISFLLPIPAAVGGGLLARRVRQRLPTGK
jgi:hypothetical protein